MMDLYRIGPLFYMLTVVHCIVTQTTVPDHGCVRISRHEDDNHCTHHSNCTIYERCSNETFCFLTYSNESGVLVPQVSGCWNEFCTDEGHCPQRIVHQKHDKLFLCCCKGHLCNRNFIINQTAHVNLPTAAPRTGLATHLVTPASTQTPMSYISVYLAIPIFGLVIFCATILYLWKKHKRRIDQNIPLLDIIAPPSPPLVTKPIELLEILSCGQFRHVWKALYEEKLVAVKIIQAYQKASWNTEKNIYSTINGKNENILKFYAAEKRQKENAIHYWIITEYHEKGSLADFLHLNSINIDILMKLATGMANGLTFLHSITPSTQKLPIAHRDIKSHNVFVKEDFTCCIGDFGSAVCFHENFNYVDAKCQVGTTRYMAPEVLEGSIGFHAEAILAIDMYAFGLVIWELLSRCDATSAPVNQYMSPYEDVVGTHPTIDDMLKCVSEKNLRPAFKFEWREHKLIREVCETVSECWDNEADARLSSNCVLMRFTHLFKAHKDGCATDYPDVHGTAVFQEEELCKELVALDEI